LKHKLGNDQNCAGDKIEKNGIDGTCSGKGKGREVFRVFVGKPEGNRILARPSLRWEDNVRINI
jgi:hypothetical protein